MDSKKKILVLVEGEKTDVGVMKSLFKFYPELDVNYEIVSYNTNIYVLYQEFFRDDELQDSLDLLQVLKAREKDEEKRKVFDLNFTDILLIFDLDPQDGAFSKEKIMRLQSYFTESSDMGKLYLNYPMVEAFYHMLSIPDPKFLSRTVTLDELLQKTYKARVHSESRGNSYRKFVTTRQECSTVIQQNIEKALALLGKEYAYSPKWIEVDFISLLEKQLAYLDNGMLYVLCTCAMYIYDYSSTLII